MKISKLLIIPGVLVSLTTISGLLLSSNITHAEESVVDSLNVTVNTACTLSSSLGTTAGVTGSTDGEGNNTYTFAMDPGTLKEVNGSIFSTVCNDSGGYALYAIGYSNNSYDTNNTKLISTLDASYNINTGVAPASPTSSTPSSWAMMLAPVTSPSVLTPPNIVLDFQSYHVVPATYTKIADYNAATASSTAPGATAQAKYQVYINSAQAADTYTGKVKYTMVHPNDAPAPTPPAPGLCTDRATCMQTSTACDITLTDGRDGATYTTATIAGTCWMTQNLRFQGTELKVGESDVTSDITMTYGQLTSGNSYTEPRIATGSTTGYGTHYNYCAASAGEVCDDTTQQDTTRSVCPAGWKLPTQAQLNALPSKDSHFAASSGLAGGYEGGSLGGAGAYGFWWGSTAPSATGQYSLRYSSNYWDIYAYGKFYGFSVRCVRAS